ncbi:hypothetical protein [Streptomyces sp. HUAS TT20]|uniref:hypothetical protein n=1 Tax=Streptomyces sp. HUAS TT20 TaxID=3447509 RepID=UPI0021D84B37|nr:hypothetical protein [Streptomyces sp. HUAS 15-9]UXY32996.1 hypothetical protein N8I87_42555 [Streptomyces sp. HUAS 15-9]
MSSWYQQTWWTYYVLPGGACALIAWIGLLKHFHGKGRLLGTARSAGLSLSVMALMCATAIGTAHLLPHLAALPPVTAGLATGAAALPRRKQDESTQPYVKILTLGVASLMERLDYRLRTDGQSWCDAFLADFKESVNLRMFNHSLKRYLLDRHRQPAVCKTVNACYEEAERAIDKALDIQTRTDEACRGEASWTPPRDPTEQERYDCLSSFAEACALSAHLLLIAYQHGRRSEQPQLEQLRDDALWREAYHSPGLPRQRRRLPFLRDRS